MQSNKKLWVALVVIAVIAISGNFTPQDKTVVREIKEQPGAVTGPDIYSPFLNVNGVRRWFTSVGLTQASSTICAIKSPAATSTLISGSVHVNINTTASTAVIGKATTPFATTTKLAQAAIAAGTELNLVASTSPATDGALTFSPNTYMVVGLAGSGAVSLNGLCQAVFQEISK